MTLARIRVAFCSVVAALLAAAWTTAAGQGTASGARNVGGVGRAPTRSRSRCRSIPKSPSARCRTACAITCARMPGRRGAPSSGSSSRPDRCSKTTTSRAWRISSSTCCSRARGTSRSRGSASSWRRSASASDRMRTRRRATTTRSTCCACRPTCRASSTARCSCSRTGPRPRRSIPRRSSGSAASCSRSGACTSAPASGRRTSCARCSWRDRATPIDPRSASPRSSSSAQREQLLRFYRDWYRPDLMAVIVVGDVDREAVATMIKNRFSSLTSPSKRPRPAFDVPERPGTRYAIVTDKETPTTAVAISDLRPARNQGSVGGYRDLIVDQLFGAILDARLDELGQRENAPFLRAAADRHLFPMPRTKDEALMQALVANDGVARGLGALVTEIERVSRFGVTETELARAKQARLIGYERVVAESPDRESASRADEYTRNFLQDEALPTIWQELAFQRRFVPGVTLAEVNALAKDWFPDHNRLVIVSAPETAGVVLPTEQQLAAAVKAAMNNKLDAYVDAAGGDAADGRAAGRRHHRQDDAAPRSGHHRVDALERRHRRSQADEAQRGSDSVPGDGAGRHVARERRRLHPRARRRRRGDGCRRRQVQRRDAGPDALGQGRRRPAVHRRDQPRHGGRQHAAGSRDDAPARPPAFHAAARRQRRVRGAGRHRRAGCSPISSPAPTWCSTRRSIPR